MRSALAGSPARYTGSRLGTARPPATFASASTHALGLAEAVELARALERLPPRLLVFGIEAASFETGAEPSAAVRAAAQRVADATAEELAPR